VPFELLRSGLTVRGLDPAEVGAVAASAGVALSSLHRRGPALEEVFLELVSGVRVHPTAADGAHVADAALPAAGAALVEGTDAEAPAPSAAERVDDVAAAEEVDDVAESLDAESAGTPGAAAAMAAAALAWNEPDAQDDAEPLVEAAVDPSPSATFAVASTGVIDIVPVAGDPATDAYADDLPPDGDADVEELGAIDAELSEPDPPQEADEIVAGDRPWENYVKTDADVEADAFFASFTAQEAADAAEAAEAAEVAEAAEADADADADAADDDTSRDDEGGEQR
jgi:ABC-2 type transport system ATP-binding protein